MQSVLFQNARIIDPSQGLDQTGDLLVVDRVIAAIGQGLETPENTQIVNASGLVLAPGIIDSQVFKTDLAAAISGGVTSVLLMPDQSPVLDDPALIERAERLGKPTLWVRPLAAATRGLNGRELAELSLMKDAGAVAVATGRQAIADPQVMLRLLRYATGHGLTVIAHNECPSLTAGAVATDSVNASRAGLPSAPAAAEALQIMRDLRLAKEAGAKLHIACVTTAEGVDLIRQAQAEGQAVTAATAPAYALLSDTALAGYRSFMRLSPPLRLEDDRAAIRAGLADGTISLLTSRHDPRTQEEKRLPFSDAAPGAVGTGTLLALGLSLVHDQTLTLPQLIALLSTNAAQQFGLPGGTLAVGSPADVVLFDAGAPWRIEADKLPGLAGNTPFDGLPVQGQVKYLLKGGERLA